MTHPGWALTRLIRLHDEMRKDLALLRRVVLAVTQDGKDAEDARSVLVTLSIRQPGWSLRAYCAGFCGFVHDHHAVEDAMLFPMLLERQGAAHPDLRTVIDKLTADHRVIAEHLDEVERALAALPGDPAAGAAATIAVERLSEHLEAHLDFEEEHLAAALNALSQVVAEDDVPGPPSAA